MTELQHPLEIERLSSEIQKHLAKIDPRKALTSLALECRSFHTAELRKAYLSQPYSTKAKALAFLNGKPRFAAMAALHSLTRGNQSITRPLSDVVKTVGSRDEDDWQLSRSRFYDAVRAFTVKQSEVGQFLSTRFDGCGRLSSSIVDSFVLEMKRATLAQRTGAFEMISPHSDRYAVAGIAPLKEAMSHEQIQRFLAKG